MKTSILRPREYDGPLDTPEDYAFADFMARLARSYRGKSQGGEESD